MAQQLNPRDVLAVIVLEAVRADGTITYDLADVIDGIAVEGTLRYGLADGTTVDRTFAVHAPAVAAR